MPQRPHRSIPAASASLLLLFGLLTRATVADDKAAGARVYAEKCASCHGASGEGSKEYGKPLAGSKSIGQLARVIEETMPEDDPGTCVGEEARSVAAYLHDAFYSKTAQARNKPARIELSRLTVRQYRNAVTDLVGSFRGQGTWGNERGLKGEYYKSRRVGRNADRVIDRLDPEVRFDFGTVGPAPESDKFKPYEFAAQWRGSVLAPETGEYEFIVRTDNATRLWVNDPDRPLIDALVKSGDDPEHRQTIYLLGGRAYPIRLEFVKSKQGVNDSEDKKAKAPPVKASISLEWKPPHRTAEVIPSHCLSPADFPMSFAVETPFPPDDRSVGYERGTSVSKAWDQAATDAAIEATAYIAGHLRELSGARDDAADRKEKLREFCLKLAERAFRRPLTDDQKKTYVDRQFEQAADPEAAVKRSCLLVLKSPRFLYRELGNGPDSYDVASRLSFGLWDSLPDAPLLEAAAGGRLATREQLTQQAERMLGDLRARSKVREFFLQWLKVDQVPDIAKDSEKYPGFDQAVASDLRTSLDLFLDDVAWGDAPDFRRLLLADDLYLNGRLAKFYGADLPADSPFRKVKPAEGGRAGVLTHPYLMSNFAYTSTSSPIHRGVFIARSVLGRSLRPPPEAVAPLAPDLHVGLSTRERVALQTSPKACVSCHEMINPLGFGLENYDAIGRFRGEEKGKPVDACGTYEPPSGDPTQFTGARELAAVLASSDETHSAFVEQFFHHLVKQPIRAFGPDRQAELTRSFASGDFNIRKLMVDIVAGSAPFQPLPRPATVVRHGENNNTVEPRVN